MTIPTAIILSIVAVFVYMLIRFLNSPLETVGGQYRPPVIDPNWKRDDTLAESNTPGSEQPPGTKCSVEDTDAASLHAEVFSTVCADIRKDLHTVRGHFS